MKKIILSLIFLSQIAYSNTKEQENIYPVLMGNTTINLPEPPNTIRITPEMGELYSMLERHDAQDIQNQYFANYFNFNGLQEGRDQSCSVFTSKRIIDKTLSKDQITEVRHLFENEFSSLLKSAELEEEVSQIGQKQLDVNAHTVGLQFLGLKILGINKIFSDEKSYFYELKKSTTTQQLDNKVTDYSLGVGGMMIVKGKLLNINCYDNVNSPEKLDSTWAKNTVLAWKTKIEQANQQNIVETTWQTFIDLIKDNFWFRWVFMLLLFLIAKRIFIKFKQ
ncbi:hypothetical protein [uncultured Haemophilus sp.]|jgi:hypothetical protein|uniref:hypothetical protein n=1 Tax=uncultured Haemophilus sp. TaxID=237779 RepID=UPI00258DC80D|nr:hypothetical protein [uncultured Haemophilus sp.]